MRGCQKRVIYIKNTGSRHFEGAYFVLRPNQGEVSSLDMIKEADRIINESFTRDGECRRRRVFKYAISFLVGALIPFTVFIAVKILA